MTIRAVYFDIGETLISETRVWSALADWLHVPRMTMFGVLGGLIAARRDHRELFSILRPDIGWEGVAMRFSKEVGDGFLYEDLYPDVVPWKDFSRTANSSESSETSRSGRRNECGP